MIMSCVFLKQKVILYFTDCCYSQTLIYHNWDLNRKNCMLGSSIKSSDIKFMYLIKMCVYFRSVRLYSYKQILFF